MARSRDFWECCKIVKPTEITATVLMGMEFDIMAHGQPTQGCKLTWYLKIAADDDVLMQVNQGKSPGLDYQQWRSDYQILGFVCLSYQVPGYSASVKLQNIASIKELCQTSRLPLCRRGKLMTILDETNNKTRDLAHGPHLKF